MSVSATHYIVGHRHLLIDSYQGRESTYAAQLRTASSSLNLVTMDSDFLFFNVLRGI